MKGGMEKLHTQRRVGEGLLCPLTEASEGLLDPVAITWASSQIPSFCRDALPAHMEPV